MPWPWHKQKTVYVPITLTDDRTFAEQWLDESFLERVAGLRGNQTYMTLVTNALKVIREAADAAETPERLLGCQEGIREIKWLLTAPVEARMALNYRRKEKQQANDDYRDSI